MSVAEAASPSPSPIGAATPPLSRARTALLFAMTLALACYLLERPLERAMDLTPVIIVAEIAYIITLALLRRGGSRDAMAFGAGIACAAGVLYGFPALVVSFVYLALGSSERRSDLLPAAITFLCFASASFYLASAASRQRKISTAFFLIGAAAMVLCAFAFPVVWATWHR